MNHFLPNTIPFSWNPKGKTVFWSGTDTPQNLNSNPKKDIWKDVHISYVMNKHGFRTYEFEPLLGEKVDIALGCSHTEGIGLPVECTWPYLVEKERPYPMINLGLGGGTTDTVARILTNITGMFDIQTVFIQWPEFARFEIVNQGKLSSILPNNAKIEYSWFLDDDMATQRFQKNRLIVKLLKHNFVERMPLKPLTFSPNSDNFQHYQDWARDGLHFGIHYHQLLAKSYLNYLTNIR